MASRGAVRIAATAAGPEHIAAKSFVVSPAKAPRPAAPVHPGDGQRFRPSLERCVRAGEPADVEYRTGAAGGRTRWIASRGRLHLTSSAADLGTGEHNVKLRRAHVMMKMEVEPLDFELPPAEGNSWRRRVDTSMRSREEIVEWKKAASFPGGTYRVGPRSVGVLYAPLG